MNALGRVLRMLDLGDDDDHRDRRRDRGRDDRDRWDDDRYDDRDRDPRDRRRRDGILGDLFD